MILFILLPSLVPLHERWKKYEQQLQQKVDALSAELQKAKSAGLAQMKDLFDEWQKTEGKKKGGGKGKGKNSQKGKSSLTFSDAAPKQQAKSNKGKKGKKVGTSTVGVTQKNNFFK